MTRLRSIPDIIIYVEIEIGATLTNKGWQSVWRSAKHWTDGTKVMASDFLRPNFFDRLSSSYEILKETKAVRKRVEIFFARNYIRK